MASPAIGAATRSADSRPTSVPIAVAVPSATTPTASIHHQPPPAYVATGATNAAAPLKASSTPVVPASATASHASTTGCQPGRGWR
ncbi:hypothetical protein [Micromonospora endophytica]|uniref:hypothetical protein n=1 Tax=Micromonospora endophytica TaxID=515350 RepID=UPI002017F489|nr:hypothetical protein [Micromonospora endophytica]